MYFNQERLNEITTVNVVNRMEGNPCIHHFGKTTLKGLDRIRNFGEITASPWNRVLKTEKEAYGFMTGNGLTDFVAQNFAAFLENMSACPRLQDAFLNAQAQIETSYKQKIAQIEHKFPKAPGHIKHRIEHARISAKEFIFENEKLIKDFINASHKGEEHV